jgi:hypothetical protein
MKRSSSYITNDNGQIPQTLACLPYGESGTELEYSENIFTIKKRRVGSDSYKAYATQLPQEGLHGEGKL